MTQRDKLGWFGWKYLQLSTNLKDMKFLFDVVCTSTEMPWIRRLSAMRKSWRWVPVFFRAPDGWNAMKIQQSHMFSLLLSKETLFLPRWSILIQLPRTNKESIAAYYNYLLSRLYAISHEFWYYKSKWYSWIWVNVKYMYIIYLYIGKSFWNAISQIRSFFQSLPGFEETIAWSPAGQFSVPRLNLMEKF